MSKSDRRGFHQAVNRNCVSGTKIRVIENLVINLSGLIDNGNECFIEIGLANQVDVKLW